MKVLITGITGFVGEYLTKYLLHKDSNIQIAGTVFDSADLNDTDRVKYYACDIQDKERVGAMISEYQPDQVYHLAAIASAADEDNTKIFDINVQGTLNLLEELEKSKKKVRIILASTGYAYGSTPNDSLYLFKETDKVNPMGPYAESKQEMEEKSKKYFNSKNLEIFITRAFNHTGPGQTTAFAVPSFCEQIAKIEKGVLKPTISVGNLEAVRDFADVRDVIKAYVGIMDNGQSGEIYNIASGKGYTIQEVLDKLLTLSDKNIKIEKDLNRMRKSDLVVSIGSYEKLNKLCGWQPEIEIDNTLKDTLDYWRNI